MLQENESYILNSSMEIRMNTTIEYDKKDNANKEAIRALWQSAFHDPAPFADYYFQWVYPKNQVIIAKQKDRLCSMLHLNPYSWTWNLGRESRILKLHYIVGVATEAECRRQGLMRKCMERALQDLAAAGEPFTYLMPAKKEYYEPFQFVTLTEERHRIWGSADFGKQDMKPVQDCRSFPVRSAFYMDRLRAEVQCEEGGLLEWDGGNGYCAYVLNRGTEPPRIVIEQFFGSKNSKDYKECNVQEEEKVQIDVWQDRIIPELYRCYGNREIEYIESQPIMLRVLDAEQFTALLPYEGRERRMNVCLTDTICRKNNGDFQMLLSPEGCRLRRREQGRELSFRESAVHWDIGRLAAFLLHETCLGEKLYVMEIV